MISAFHQQEPARQNADRRQVGAAVGGGIGYCMDRQGERSCAELRGAMSTERGDTIALNMQGTTFCFAVGSSPARIARQEVLKAVAIVLKKYDGDEVSNARVYRCVGRENQK